MSELRADVAAAKPGDRARATWRDNDWTEETLTGVVGHRDDEYGRNVFLDAPSHGAEGWVRRTVVWHGEVLVTAFELLLDPEPADEPETPWDVVEQRLRGDHWLVPKVPDDPEWTELGILPYHSIERLREAASWLLARADALEAAQAGSDITAELTAFFKRRGIPASHALAASFLDDFHVSRREES